MPASHTPPRLLPAPQQLLKKKAYCKLEEGGGAGGAEACRGLKVWEVNEKLDELAAAGGSLTAQVPILRWFLGCTTPTMMRWLVQIILKDVKASTGGRAGRPSSRVSS